MNIQGTLVESFFNNQIDVRRMAFKNHFFNN
ncbi:hypothetical protein M125_5831, partial [Bacteroides fragilis str. 3998T(B)3]